MTTSPKHKARAERASLLAEMKAEEDCGYIVEIAKGLFELQKRGIITMEGRARIMSLLTGQDFNHITKGTPNIDYDKSGNIRVVPSRLIFYE